MRKTPELEYRSHAQTVLHHPASEWGGPVSGQPAVKPIRPPGPENRSWLLEGIWAILLFLLLREWIVPIADLSDATDASPTIPLTLAVGAFIFLDYLRVSVFVGLPLKLYAALTTVSWLFNNHAMPDKHWFAEYIRLTVMDLDKLFASDWEAVSGENRTLLFLIGWAMLAGVIQTILVHRKRGLWLVGATLVYLGALAMAAGADTAAGVVRTAVIGFLLTAVLQFSLLRQRYATGLLRGGRAEGAAAAIRSNNVRNSSRSGKEPSDSLLFIPSAANGRSSRLLLWIALSLLFVAVLFSIGYGSAYRQNRSVEPVDAQSFYGLAQSVGWNIGEGSEEGLPYVPEKARTGYGDDDSRLGGSLTEDTGLVFTAKTEIPTYWRGESKSFYDGKGWTEPAEASDSRTIPESPASTGSLGRIITQEMTWKGGPASSLLFAGGAIQKLEALISEKGNTLAGQHLHSNPATGKYTLTLAKGDRLSYAKMQVAVPERNAERLRKAGADVPQEIRGRYLQLPADLPKRVAELAQQVIKGADNPYDQAVALETFLKKNYIYRLTGGLPAGKNEDFVDAFLFRQGSGYCDYFSTAMTVMLRTAGIPARWVKGFAPGEVQKSPDGAPSAGPQDGRDSFYTVSVKNKDAHSWVEAYFPGEGWIAFDPTPGFSGFDNPSGNGQAVGESSESPDEQAKAGSSLRGSGWINGKALAGSVITKFREWPRYADYGVRLGRDASAQIGQMGRELGVAGGFALLFVLLGVFLWRNRYALGSRFILRKHRHAGRNPELLIRLLDQLWHRVFQLYGPKSSNETLREYVGKLKPSSPEVLEALVSLAKMYEDARYGGRRFHSVPYRRIRQVWQNVYRKKADALYIPPME